MNTLHRYQDKEVRITTEDGAVFTGVAELFSSGYGLHEFDREEEGIQLDDVILFKSDIRSIEELPEPASGAADPRRFDEMMGALLEGPYWIVDILPEQVSAEAAVQYFAVERYFLRPERIVPLRRKYAEILLRLNCYCDMAASFDSCASWETNPDPEAFAARVEGLSGNEFLRAVFAEQNAMIDYDHNDTYLTVYDPDRALLDKIRALAAAEGLFVWRAPREE
ncbi:MAG: hypothetical protein IJJ43_00920 [Oscillospiraceae bacterium]|nr:hypothetical protein [Oscillospiraceae bacterium]